MAAVGRIVIPPVGVFLDLQFPGGGFIQLTHVVTLTYASAKIKCQSGFPEARSGPSRAENRPRRFHSTRAGQSRTSFWGRKPQSGREMCCANAQNTVDRLRRSNYDGLR